MSSSKTMTSCDVSAKTVESLDGTNVCSDSTKDLRNRPTDLKTINAGGEGSLQEIVPSKTATSSNDGLKSVVENRSPTSTGEKTPEKIISGIDPEKESVLKFKLNGAQSIEELQVELVQQPIEMENEEPELERSDEKRESDVTPEEDVPDTGFEYKRNYDVIAQFNLDEMDDDVEDDDELPSLQEIYQRCQLIKRKRFYEDMYNIRQKNIEDEQRADAIKILKLCGFCKMDEDDDGDGLDTALLLVPDRFWHQESHANEICIEDLRVIVEEKKDSEQRKQFQEYCEAAERSRPGGTRRRAMVVGGGSSAILQNYLKMNLINCNVPMYYLPSYLNRYNALMSQEYEDRSGDV